MPARGPEAKANRERCATGIEGIDHILNGGIPRGNTGLVAGSVGTGKTSICIEVLVPGGPEGGNSPYLSVTEPTAKLLKNVIPFDFFDDRLTKQGRLRFVDLPHLYEKLGIDKAEFTFDEVKLLVDRSVGLVAGHEVRRVVPA